MTTLEVAIERISIISAADSAIRAGELVLTQVGRDAYDVSKVKATDSNSGVAYGTRKKRKHTHPSVSA